MSRVRRDSRDAPLSATSTASDPAIGTGGNFARGGFRGRGRGDWDFKGRGKGTFPDDREDYRARSRSQDKRWEKPSTDDRERERIADRRDERRNDLRDEERKPDRVDRERDAERWKRDQVSGRVESRNPSGSSTAPSTPLAPSAGNLHPSTADRLALREAVPGPVVDRRTSNAAASSSNREHRREGEKPDYFSSRAEAARERYGPRVSSPPPQAPQVPAFGSVSYRPTPGAGFGTNVWRATKDERPPQAPAVPKVVPTGPKAQVNQAPTGPRAEQPTEKRPYFTRGPIAPRYPRAPKERPLPPRQDQMPTVGPSGIQVVEASSHPHPSSRGLDHNTPALTPARVAPAAAQTLPRPTSSSSPQPSGKSAYTTPSRGATPGDPPAPAFGTSSSGLKSSPRLLNTNIPTGPRAGRVVPPLINQAPTRPTPPSGPLAQGSPKTNQWLRSALPKYPKVPSIMNTVPAKRDWSGEEKDRSLRTEQHGTKPHSAYWGGVPTTDSPRPYGAFPRPSDDRLANRNDAVKTEDTLDDIPNSLAAQISSGINSSAVLPKSLGLKLDSEGSSADTDDDDDMDLDEEDFADSEARFSREMAILEAKKTEATRHGNTRAVGILQVAHLWDTIENEVKNLDVTEGTSSGFADATRQLHTGLPSPKADETSDVEMDDSDSALREVPADRAPTPAIESLPFLNAGPPTPFSELGIIQENANNHEKVKHAIRAEIMKQRDYVAEKHERLRDVYVALYKPWRIMVQEMDNRRKQEKATTPAPTSPAPAISPVVAPAPLIEGRRAGKFSSELELERILRESELAAKEEEERRDREAKAKTDTEKEAMIPEMLDEFEAEARVFKDTNQFVHAKLALGVFAFVPPVDDFTPEEQKVFTDNFLAYPKRWGKIAEALPGRDYKQCIEHYYLTKEEAKYKVKLNRRWSKKGRKAGRAPQTRPKSNALMSDLGVHPEIYEGDEPEPPTIAVTDTGRPKRAAAPTFGDVGVDAEPTPIPTPGRKSVAPKGEANVEGTIERPTAKRTKTTQPREKGQRRGKAPLLAAAPGPSPQKPDREGSRGISREPKLEDEQKAKDLEIAGSLASLPTVQIAGPVGGLNALNETWFGQSPVISGQNETTRQQPQQPQQQPQPQQQKSASQTSSYWSVPEQTDFQKLVAHFGTDWLAIANWMKSKTHTMVCILFRNYP